MHEYCYDPGRIASDIAILTYWQNDKNADAMDSGSNVDDDSGDFEIPWGNGHLFALLVLCCPCLKQIEIQGDTQLFRPAYGLLQTLTENSRGASGEQAGSQVLHLDELFINNDHRDDGLADHVHEYIDLPGLRVLRVSGLSDQFDELQELETELVEIQQLSVDGCIAHLDTIDCILSRCHELRILDVTWDGAEYFSTYPNFFADFMNMLSEATPLLEHLRLETDTLEPERPQYAISSIGSFRRLQHLQSLTITKHILLGIDGNGNDSPCYSSETRFPDSMKYLKIVAKVEELGDAERSLLNMTGTARLERFQMYDYDKSECISRKAESNSRKRRATDDPPGQPAINRLKTEEDEAGPSTAG